MPLHVMPVTSRAIRPARYRPARRFALRSNILGHGLAGLGGADDHPVGVGQEPARGDGPPCAGKSGNAPVWSDSASQITLDASKTIAAITSADTTSASASAAQIMAAP